MKKKLLSMLLIGALAVSMLVGCGSKEEEAEATVAETVSEEESGELTTLSFGYAGFATRTADTVPRLEKYLAEKLGIKMDIWMGGTAEDEMNTMLSSGDYSDIIIWKDAVNLRTAVDGGNLVDLMQYKDQLPAIFENDLYAPGIEFIKDQYGDGEALYGLPMAVGSQEGVYAYSPMLRWDAYKAVGTPEITDWDNFLDVLEEMQKAAPKTAEGQNTYAVSLAGTDLGTMWYTAIETRGIHDRYKVVNVSQDCNTVESIFEEGSAVIEGIQWLFEANQRGLLDPDSATQSAEDYQAKCANGQVLYTPFNWWGALKYNTDERVNAEEPYGYAEVWADCFVLPSNADNLCGNSRTVCITTDCEDIDAALKYLNWLYSEGADLMLNDFEGFLYTLDAEGKRVPTEAYLSAGMNAVHEDGSTNMHLREVLGTDVIITADTINEETGVYSGITSEEAFKSSVALTKLDEEWLEWNGGYATMWDKYKGTDNLVKLSSAYAFKGALDDETQQLHTTIHNMLPEVAIKMIYAKDQAEFDALWAQYKADAETLGYEELYDAISQDIENSKLKAEKYGNAAN